MSYVKSFCSVFFYRNTRKTLPVRDFAQLFLMRNVING